MNKNQEFFDTVSDFGANGEGVIKRDNIAVFTPFVCKGEKIKYKVLKVGGNCAFGKLIEVISPSGIRVKPKCEVFGKCGGCQLQHVDYDEQIKIKTENVKRCFYKIAGIELNDIKYLKCNNPYGYRNKLQLPVGETENGTVIGFYAENSHRIIPIQDCPINPSWTKDIISAFYKYVKEFNVKGYNQICKNGELREITVKEIDGNLIITAVVLNQKLRGLDRLVEILKESLNNNFSLFLNVNKDDTNVIYGKEFIKVYGEKEYYSEMKGIKYKTGVLSFMQVNREICEELYSEVLDKLLIDENTTVIDAYSGAGLMTAMAGKNAKKAIGIEIIGEAVDIANELAFNNGLSDKIVNYCGKCEELLPDIIEKEKSSGNKISIILDPPRKGCDVNVINAVKCSGADRIVYVSCLPSSLARDVGLITGKLFYDGKELKKSDNPENKYNISYIKTFDMFPQTKHVETLCVLEKTEDK